MPPEADTDRNTALRDLDNLIAEMGGLVEAQLAGAIAAVARRDAEKAARVAEGDEAVDALENKINASIKYRESFRPFAPAILEERTEEYFQVKGSRDVPFMEQALEDIRAGNERGKILAEGTFRVGQHYGIKRVPVIKKQPSGKALLENR